MNPTYFRQVISRPLAGSVALLVATLWQPANASAAAYTWDANGATSGVTDGAGTWNTTAGNAVWWDGAANTVWSNAGPNDAVFGNCNGAAGIVTIGTAITVRNLTFEPPGSGNYVLQGAANVAANTITFSGAAPVITANASGTIAALVSSTNGFVKEGLGTLTLKGSTASSTVNSIGGTITVNAGTLAIGPNFVFGGATGEGAFQGNLTVANLGRYREAAADNTSNAGLFTVGAAAYAEFAQEVLGAVAGSGRIDNSNFIEVRSGTADYAGVMSGAGGFVVRGATQTLSGANLHSGTTSVASGSLILKNVNAVQNSALSNPTAVGTVSLAVAGTNTYNFGALSGGGNLNIGANTISLGATNLSATSDTVVSGSGGVTKLGTGTQSLRSASLYTGTTTLGGGKLELLSNGALSASSPIVVNGTSEFTITGGIRTVGTLNRTAGNATISTAYNNVNTSLTVTSLPARTAGATANFVLTGGTNGTTNKIVLADAAPDAFIDHGSFFGGNNFAWNDSGGYVRAMRYSGPADTGAVTSAGGGPLTSAVHQEITGPVSGQTDAAFTTLKIAGAHAFALAGAQTVTVDGILKTGTNATISGGAGLRASAGRDLVVRTNALADALTINTPILANGSNALAKSGLGDLTFGVLAVNTHTGGTFLNQGKLIAVQDSNFGSTAAVNNIALNGGTLQTGANLALHANHGLDVGPGGGAVFGNGFGLTFANANQLSGTGPLAITGTASSNTVLTSSATQDYSGRMTVGVDSFFAGRIALGADNLTNPFGTGDITVVTGGAGSSVYVNRPGSVWDNRFYLSGNGAGRGVIQAEQGGTFNGDVILTANASISSDGTATTTTLKGNISGPFTLTLGGQTGASAANQYVLTGNNVHSATIVGLGITNFDRDVALGAYNGTTTIQGNATLQAAADGIVLNPDRTVALTGGASGRHIIDVQGFNLTILGTITGASTETLVVRGSGRLVLGCENPYTGPTAIDGSRVNLDKLANRGLPSGIGTGSPGGSAADLVLGGATLVIEPMTATGTDRPFTIGDAAGLTARIEASGVSSLHTVSFTSSGDIEFGGFGARELILAGTNTGTNRFDPRLRDGAGGFTGLTKSDAGTWFVTGANTYTGVTRITGGILNVATLANTGVPSSIGLGSSLQDPIQLVIAGGTLQHTAANVASTNWRLTVGDASSTTATIDSSAASAVNTVRLVNPGALGMGGTGPRELHLVGTNTGDNLFAPAIGDGPGGATSLFKQGEGKWLVTGANSYTGPTRITAGTLALRDNGSFASSPEIAIAAGATLDVSGVTGGANHDGTRFVVRSGQTLHGRGTVVGAVDVEGVIAPGNSIGTLSVDSLSLTSANATFELEIDLGLTPDADLLNVAGGITLAASTLDLSLFNLSPMDLPETFLFVANDLSDPVLGTFGTITGLPAGYTALLDYDFTGTDALGRIGDGNDIAITFGAVPEPGTALFGLALCGIAGLRRHRATRAV